MVVVGHNGIGKSTLLKLIAGLARPTEGAVRFSIDSTPVPRTQWRDLIGFVGPDVYLYRELTAREHVLLLARLRGLAIDAAAAGEVLARVSLAGREDEPTSNFSSGMIQRLRYGLATLHQPSVLLLDEPTTNLDAEGIALVDRIIAAHQGILVVATNDPREMRYGELVLAL